MNAQPPANGLKQDGKRLESMPYPIQTNLHTQEVTGSSPVVSTKKFLISCEIRNFSFLFAAKKFTLNFCFFFDQYTDQDGD